MEKVKIDRRKLLVTGAVAPVVLAAPAIASGKAKHEWKLVTSLPKTLPGPGDSSLRWADRITKISGGEINIKVFGGGEIVPAFGTQEAVENGTVQAYHGSGSWFSGRHLAHAFFTSAPYGATPDEMNAWMHYGGGQAFLDEFTNPRGLQLFLAGGTSIQSAGWFKKPINSLADLQGLNFRITGFGAKVMSAIGMNAVSTPPSEIFPALQSGALDGAEWVGPDSDLAFGFQKIMTHMYTPSTADVYGGMEFGINKKAWDALSDELQDLVRLASEGEALISSANDFHSNVFALDKLREVEGLTIGTLPEDVLDALAVASKQVMDETAASDEFIGRLSKSYYDYVGKASAYKELYDAPFNKARRSFFS